MFPARASYWLAIVASVALLSACAKLDSEPPPDHGSSTIASGKGTADPQAEKRTTDSLSEDENSEATADIHRWSTKMRPNQTARIINNYGDIRIKSSADSGLHFAGAVQKLDGELRDPEFGTNKFAGGLELAVEAPEHWKGRVDAGIRVPKAAPLETKTTTGSITIRVSNNSIVASSDSGQLALRSAGAIIATSDSGRIRTTFEGERYEGEAGSLKSATGNIDIWVQPGASLHIVATAPNVTNNIPTTMAQSGQENDGAAFVKLGDGGARLHALTQQGSITINVLPVAQSK